MEDKHMPRERRKWSAEDERRWQEAWTKYLQVRADLEAQKPMLLDPRHPTPEEQRTYSEWFGVCIQRWDAVLGSRQRDGGNPELEKELHDLFERIDAARSALELADK